MSLRNFHLVFISVCVLLCLGYAFWALVQFRAGGSAASALTAIGSLAVGAALVRYAGHFLRRCRQTGIL